MIGRRFRNKHNGRMIEIVDELITDTGNKLYKGRGFGGNREGHFETDFYAEWALERHWIILTEDGEDE